MAMQSGFIKRIRDIMRMDAGINGDAQRIEQSLYKDYLMKRFIELLFPFRLSPNRSAS